MVLYKPPGFNSTILNCIFVIAYKTLESLENWNFGPGQGLTLLQNSCLGSQNKPTLTQNKFISLTYYGYNLYIINLSQMSALKKSNETWGELFFVQQSSSSQTPTGNINLFVTTNIYGAQNLYLDYPIDISDLHEPNLYLETSVRIFGLVLGCLMDRIRVL